MNNSFETGFSDGEDSDLKKLIGNAYMSESPVVSEECPVTGKKSQRMKTFKKQNFPNRVRSKTPIVCNEPKDTPILSYPVSQENCFPRQDEICNPLDFSESCSPVDECSVSSAEIYNTQRINSRWKSNFPGPAGVITKSIKHEVPELKKWKNFHSISNQANAGIASQPCLTETQSPSAFWSKIKTQLEPKILEFTVKYNISTILSQMKSKRTKWPWLVGYVVAEEYICGKDGRIVLKDDSSSEITAFCHRDVIEAYSHYFQHGGVLLLKDINILRTHVVLNSWNFVRIYSLNNNQEVDIKELQKVDENEVAALDVESRNYNMGGSFIERKRTKQETTFFDDENLDDFSLITDEEIMAASLTDSSPSSSAVNPNESNLKKCPKTTATSDDTNVPNLKSEKQKFHFKTSSTSPKTAQTEIDISIAFEDEDFESVVKDLDINSFSENKDYQETDNKKKNPYTSEINFHQIENQVKKAIGSHKTKIENKFSFKNRSKNKTTMDQKTLKDDQNFQKSNSNAIRKRERKNISNSAISESFIKKIDSSLSPFKKKIRESHIIRGKETAITSKKQICLNDTALELSIKPSDIKTELFPDDKLDDLMAEGNLDDWLNS